MWFVLGGDTPSPSPDARPSRRSPQDWGQEQCGDDPLLTGLSLELQEPMLSLTDGQLSTLRTLCTEVAAAAKSPGGSAVPKGGEAQPPAQDPARGMVLEIGTSGVGDREPSPPLSQSVDGPDTKKASGGVASRMWGFITNEAAAAGEDG